MFNKIFIPFLIFVVLGVAACSSDWDDLNKRVDDIESQMALMQENMKLLSEASKNNKSITDIEYIEVSKENGEYDYGWRIHFSDESFIEIFNGKNGISPYLKVDEEGYWIVSYDGYNYDFLLDTNGNKVKCHSGESNGRDSLCVRVNINDDGYYVFEIYNPSKPEITIEKIVTPYKADPSVCISSIVKDEGTGCVTIVMANGETFNFNLYSNYPSGIVILSIDSLKFSYPGDEACLDFRVNPSSYIFNYDVTLDNCDIELKYLNEDATNLKPFYIKEITPALDDQKNRIEGQFTMTLKDHGTTIEPYKAGAYLLLYFLDSKGERVSVTSNVFVVDYECDDLIDSDSNIPVLVIETPSPITSKLDWTEGCSISILNADKYDQTFSNVQIKGRGNTTWLVSKKPYAIKLDKKAEVLGLPKHKRWVLLANHLDHSNLRNDICFFMGKMSLDNNPAGLEYTPRSKFMRVIMNGKYQGLYQLTEQIKADDKRVNVGDDGFILEIDARAGGDPDDVFFNVGHIPHPLVIKEPDVVAGDNNYNYISKFMENVDSILFSDKYLDETSGYKSLIDINSFIDWYLVNEITKNNDAMFFSSCYMNLKRDGKLKMGPIWDFDFAMGNYIYSNPGENANNSEGLWVKKTKWFTRMFSDPAFISILKERFNYYYINRQKIYDYIDEKKLEISNALLENDMRWFIYSNPFDSTITLNSFYNECDEIKAWLEHRINWLDSEFSKL